jgi:hypothetical protein
MGGVRGSQQQTDIMVSGPHSNFLLQWTFYLNYYSYERLFDSKPLFSPSLNSWALLGFWARSVPGGSIRWQVPTF